MKRLVPLAAFCAVLLLVVCLKTGVSFAQKGSEKAKAGSDQVKLYSDAVEVIEVGDKAEACPSTGGATTLRLRVKSATPVDVRLYFSTRKGGWASADHLNKKSGDEITSTECFPKARYKVQTRPAGSTNWPNL